MRQLRHLFRASLALLFMAGCHPSEDIPTHSTYTFTNMLSKSVYLDVYNNRGDYLSNQNLVAQYQIMPGAAQAISLRTVDTSYIEWYSSDFLYNNWLYNTNLTYSGPSPLPPLPVAIIDDSRTISDYYPDCAKGIILDGNKAQTTWRSIPGQGTSSTGISGIEISFKKDFTGVLTMNNASGGSAIIPMSFYDQASTSGTGGRANLFLSLFTGNSNPGSGPATLGNVTLYNIDTTLPLAGRDTILVYVNNNGAYYSGAVVEE